MRIDAADPQCGNFIVETFDGFAHSHMESFPTFEAAEERYVVLTAEERVSRREAHNRGQNGSRYARIALYQLLAVEADDHYLPGGA
jgi:hypothetical protein